MIKAEFNEKGIGKVEIEGTTSHVLSELTEIEKNMIQHNILNEELWNMTWKLANMSHEELEKATADMMNNKRDELSELLKELQEMLKKL